MTGVLRSLATLLPNRADYAGLRRTWRSDIAAGVTVGIVALPLALAFGVSSGVGAEAGLVTAIVAGLVAAVFGGSHVQVSGPTGAMVVVLAPIALQHGAGAIATVSVLAGIIVLVGGLLRLGRIVSVIPWPVIEGFTVGIAVIIFLQQIPAAFGVSGAGHGSNALIAAVDAVAEAAWPLALAPLAVVSVVGAVMLVLPRLDSRIPASFIAIVVVTVAVGISGLPLDVIGALPETLPTPSIPTLDVETVAGLIGPACAVAALAAIESLLSARVAGTLADTGQVNGDRELVGQGLASVASGLFGGMPATGAIARTAVNVRSGGRTRVAAIVHALALLAVVTAVGMVVAWIPLAALAGVLMVTAARMVSLSVIRQVMRASRADAAVFVITALITVSFDLILAVGIGVAVAGVFALRTLSRTSGVRRERLPGAAVPGDERIALITVEGSLFFGAADRIVEQIDGHRDIAVVIIRLSQLHVLDATGSHTLGELVASLERRGVTVIIKGVQVQHRPILERTGVIASLRHPHHLFADLDHAVAHARSHSGEVR